MPRTKEKVLGYYIKHDKDRKLFNKRSRATSTNQSQREKLLCTVLQREQGGWGGVENLFEIKVEKVIFKKSKPEQLGEYSSLHTITKDKYSYNALKG